CPYYGQFRIPAATDRDRPPRRRRAGPSSLTAFDVIVTDADLTEAAAEGIRAGGSFLVLTRS
ncbi:hypothetical protein ACWEQ7_25765, partial [Streptomyces sp. NPDC004069]